MTADSGSSGGGKGPRKPPAKKSASSSRKKPAGGSKKQATGKQKAVPKRQAAKPKARPKPKPRKGDTAEYELGEDFLSDITEEERISEGQLAEPPEAGDLRKGKGKGKKAPPPAPAGDDDDEYLDEEDELERVISAPTQEWDGLDAAEAESESEQTLVIRSREQAQKARSAITSGFEKVGGEKITSGFSAVRQKVGFPIWLRFLSASLVIIISIAAATSTSLILYLTDFADALKKNSIGQDVEKDLAPIPDSGAQTILIIGSDRRNGQISGKYGLSDTTMMLRLDPDRNAIALLSLPRDLKVSIPGYGTDKLNAAYSLGGPKLTLQTVKQLTGLHPNHLVNIDFTGFARAVNAIGCVYVDVDRRYFIAPNTGTSEINLQPGYQALCGFDALSYARYRHTDNDIVRAARQQTFLREARAKVPTSKLIEDREQLLRIFAHYTSSDVDDTNQLLQLLKLLVDLRGAQIKEIHFNGTLGPSFVTATQGEVDTAVNQFLGVRGTPGPAGSSAKSPENVAPEQPPDFTPPTPAAKKQKKAKKKKGGSGESTNLTSTSYGKQLARQIQRRGVKVPVFYPTVLESGSDYAQKPRVYKINGKGDGAPPHAERGAYKWVFSLPSLGDYYGFEGTAWKDPPIFSATSEEKTIGDRDYKLFYDGDRLRMVGWQTDDGSFWVSNSLIETISNADMLKIAQGFRELPGS